MIFGQRTHEDFYFYDYFIALELPLIVTEGHTDPVYLRNAIRRLAAAYPKLGVKTPGRFEFKVRFFNYDNMVTRLLRMGGSDPLKNLALDYEKRLARYAHRPLTYPVIILLDSDAGLKEFSAAVLKKLGKTINLTTTDPFYHLAANLYVVKTPEPAGGGQSCIEDLFGAAKSLPLDGKILHLDEKTFDSSKHIGKSYFARRVVAKNVGAIDWTGFTALLDRIVGVLDHYVPPPEAIGPPPPAPAENSASGGAPD